MKAIIGFATTSPLVVREYINQWKDTLPKEKADKLKGQYVGIGEELKDTTVVAMFPYLRAYRDQGNGLDSFKGVAMVFDSPIILSQANIPMADAVGNSGYKWSMKTLTYDSFVEVLRGALNKPSSAVKPQSIRLDQLPQLLGRNEGKLSQILLNANMLTKNPEARRDLTILFAHWLNTGKDVKVLLAQLEVARYPEEVVSFFSKHLDNPWGNAVSKIFKVIATRLAEKKQINYDNLVKDTGISAFDVRYFLKLARVDVYESVNKTTTEIHSDNRNSGARNMTPAERREIEELLAQAKAHSQKSTGGLESEELEVEAPY